MTAKNAELIPVERIREAIILLRGQKVMLDRDLAALYGVQTKALKQAVKRNADRFPDDFMFVLSAEEFATLRSQFVTSKGAGNSAVLRYQIGTSKRETRGGTQYAPMAFTVKKNRGGRKLRPRDRP